MTGSRNWMAKNYVNLVKLCVGAPSVEHLEHWQSEGLRGGRWQGTPEHVTRMKPRRANEVLSGGSLYWVIRGYIQARQRITALEARNCEDGITRCAIVFDPEIVRTVPIPRRAFQGWRYLPVEDSPADISSITGTNDELPPELAAKLLELGVI